MECCFLLDFSFVFLVLLPWSVSGTFTVIGPQQPITALVHEEAIFTCQLSPQTDAQYMDVIWFYSQNGYVVHHYKYRQDYLKYQHKNYKGRTEFLRDGISKGSVALKLRHIRPSDEGKYRCFFESPYAYEGAEFQVFVAEKFTVIGPQQPIIALLGGEATFPCHLSPQMDAQNMNVMWFYGQFSNLVHQYKNSQDNLKHQHQEYKGRTEFLRDDISNGSVALKLRHIRPSDEGKYQCSFESPHVYEKAEFQVYVAGKGSVPHIHNESIGHKEFRLTCTSTGWYPEPEVWWRKNQEESLSEDTKIMKDENGLFSIETSITASSDSTVNVSCFIWNHLLNQKLEANVSLPDALSPNDPSWMVIVPVVLVIAVCIIFIVTWNLKKGKGMCKDESGIAKVESDSLLQPSAESNVATSVSKNATGMCKDESGIAKVESDSLLQPSAESNVATSVSKNATGMCKDESGITKVESGVSKDASGVIKHEPVVKKEATDEPEFLRKRKEIFSKSETTNMERLTGTHSKGNGQT
ncbi:butyrophilin-like protein 2 isoform 2-T2 [Sarcophilus harrisii]